MTAQTSRRRGGQPGNNNARKHGFYASKLPQSDRRALDTSEFSGLTEEISLMRALIRRVISLTPPPDDFYANLDSLRVLCHATTALSRLLRTHALLGISSEFELARDQALREIAIELGLDKLDAHNQDGDDSPDPSGFADSSSTSDDGPSSEPYQPL